ncbi:MAG: hypothetical protein DU429_06575 [Candidatus Tokpelaia sp.]|nr:MAG: hypothetical protein DU430_04435 [Candidatus Tokpelaia sp.]KAA6206223.1 MAG: hypothetical protein DU429_06575 [Candidatus Tokpelaia sp.]
MLLKLGNRDRELITITREAVFAEHDKKTSKGKDMPRRRCFAQNSGLNKAKKIFSVPILSAKLIFEKDTGIKLFFKPEYGNYWRRCLTDDEIRQIELWEQQNRRLVFLRDCLSLSVALDFNFVSKAGNYTVIGQWEHDAKTQQDNVAITELAKETAQVIQNLPFYKDADYVCAVPPAPHKGFDLPSSVVAQVSCGIGKSDITSEFHFGGDKAPVKDAGLAQKWDIWENAVLSFKKNINGKTVVLVDNKYQAGVTLQYIAMKLQRAGAHEVYGLCFVKTWGDQDNQGR